jgi:hypothetical protein
LFRLAADKGHAKAQLVLGTISTTEKSCRRTASRPSAPIVSRPSRVSDGSRHSRGSSSRGRAWAPARPAVRSRAAPRTGCAVNRSRSRH